MAKDSPPGWRWRLLRNGVPNRAAVKILGCNQPKAERRFEEMLRDAADGDNPPRNALGMLVSGDFGTGKSHLLTHLEHRALSEGFVCSTVAISKETPLYDSGQGVQVRHGQRQDAGPYSGRLIEELGQSLRPDSEEYAKLLQVGQHYDQVQPTPPDFSHQPAWSTNAPTKMS